METVNPMPAALPVAAMNPFPAPAGSWANFNLLAARDEARIPIGLPATRPKKIPQATGEESALSIISDLISTPVFAKAKSGTTKNELIGCSFDSSHSITDTDSFRGIFGVNNPRITPANVG